MTLSLSFPVIVWSLSIVAGIIGIILIYLSQKYYEYEDSLGFGGVLVIVLTIGICFGTLSTYYEDLEYKELFPGKWYGLFMEMKENDIFDDEELCRDFCRRFAPEQPKLSAKAIDLIIERSTPKYPIAILLQPFVIKTDNPAADGRCYPDYEGK